MAVVWETNRKQGAARIFPSTANYLGWRRGARSFEAFAHWRVVYFNLPGDGRIAAERLQGARVSPEFLPMLGGLPSMGRGFTADDRD